MTFAGVLCNNTLRHGLVALYPHAFVCECLFVVCHVQILGLLSRFGSLLIMYTWGAVYFIFMHMDNILFSHMERFANAKM